MSNLAFANITPVKPPTVNKKIKPLTQYKEAKRCSLFIGKPYNVANQLNIFIPVGTAIIIVADVKYARVSTSRPTVYM